MPRAQAVLVLDDEPELREDLAELLVGAGFSAEGRGDARSLTDAEFGAFDVVILDLAMPGTDGLSVLGRLAHVPQAPRIIFISGHGEDVLQTAAAVARREHLQVAGVLRKPFTAEDVLRLLGQSWVPLDSGASIAWSDADIRSALAEAIDERALSVAFQPKVTAKGLIFAGAEALLTGDLPRLGYVSPDIIVRAATREPELIGAMSLEVLRCSAAACRAWIDAGWDVPVSVNLPFEVLCLPDISERLLSPIHEEGLMPRHVIFELTEDAIYDSSSDVLAILARLRLAGFGLSLDDVGRRQSGLLQLANLPITEVKIALQLLAQARTWSKSRSVFVSVAELGHRLGLTVVAEGVETRDDLVLVRSLPVDYVQGYLVSRKQHLPDLLAMLAASSSRGAPFAPDHVVPIS